MVYVLENIVPRARITLRPNSEANVAIALPAAFPWNADRLPGTRPPPRLVDSPPLSADASHRESQQNSFCHFSSSDKR